MARLNTLLLTTALCGFLMQPTHAVAADAPLEEAVILTGWLHVDDQDMADVTLMVKVNGRTRPSGVSSNGRFTVSLPRDADVVLRFEKPGHVPKELVVDTRHARTGEQGHRTRRVKLAVTMDPERHMADLTYAGPVGTLSFDEGGGCLAVQHSRKTTRTERSMTVTF